MFSKVFWQHGENQRMWLTDLKIAIVEKNIKKLDSLMDEIPQLDTNKERGEALYLIKEGLFTELVFLTLFFHF